MFYRAYELRRAATRRLVDAADFGADTLGRLPHPVNRSLPVRTARSVATVARSLQLTHDRPLFGVDAVEIDGRTVDVVAETTMQTPFGSLVHFVKSDHPADQPKVLIVPGLAGHFATLVRGTVATMLTDHDVYVADWHNARDVPVAAGRFGLDEYIQHLMDFLRATGPGTHVLSVCQPAVACIAAAAIMAEDGDAAQPASLILLAGPVDTRIKPGRINRLAQRQPVSVLKRTALHVVPRGFAGAGRTVYPGFLQVSGFMGLAPRRHVDSFRTMFRDLQTGNETGARKVSEFYQEYFAVLDIAGEFFVDTVTRVFRDNDLPLGEFYWRGRVVKPELIKTALFTIEGELDEMCPPGQTAAAHALCDGIPVDRRRTLVASGVGHYGVFAGSTFEREIYPQIRDFVRLATGSNPKPTKRGTRKVRAAKS